MDFKDMTYVLAIEKYGNISRAAEALYISQPSLSRFLQNLEREVGQPLFRRIGNRYLPTYIGERYLEHARQILQEKQDLDKEISDIIQADRGVLRIGFPAMRCTYMLPCTLPIFRRLYPNIQIQLREANSDKLNDLLLSGEIDLAFYNYSDRNPQLEYSIISHEELLLVMSSKSELATHGVPMEGCKYPHFDLWELGDTGVIMQRSGQRTRQIVERMFRELDFHPNIILESSNIQAEAELAARNYGVAFITETHLKHMNLHNEIICFSVGNPMTPVDFVAAYRGNSYLPKYAQDYMDIVRDFT